MEEFTKALAGHPDPQRVSYVLDGLQHGFKLGFHQFRLKLKSSSKNKLSASQHPAVIDEYLANEVALGRVAGPTHPLHCLICK